MFIMYNSGTTAKPKGSTHTGGYLTPLPPRTSTSLDVKAGADVCWTAADIG